jgi:hypothetical protein
MRLGAVAFLLAAASCAGQRKPLPVVALHTSGPAMVAVLPFRVGGELDPNIAFAERRDLPPVPEDVGVRMAEALGQALTRNGVTVVRPSEVLHATPPAGAARYDSALGARVAKDLGVPFAVLGALTRFVEREGSAWGTNTPATVWYQAVLVEAANGEVVSSERFEHTQQPLSQNLLDLPRFLQRRGRWVTREEMLTGGLDETGANLARAIRATPSR